MPAIASLGDLKAAQKDLLEAKDLDELRGAFKKWRRIGWKNICKLWLLERTPEELKGGGMRFLENKKSERIKQRYILFEVKGRPLTVKWKKYNTSLP